MKDPRLYERVESPDGIAKFIPVAERNVSESLANGRWLIVIEDGMTSVRRALSGSPEFDAALIRFSRILIDKVAIQLGTHQFAPNRPPLRAEAARLHEALRAECGSQMITYMRPAVANAVEDALKAWKEYLGGSAMQTPVGALICPVCGAEAELKQDS